MINEKWQQPKADKITGPKIIGKIDLSTIDSSVKPIKSQRDYLDSGWAHSFLMMKKNYRNNL
jgi:hypothetical protein